MFLSRAANWGWAAGPAVLLLAGALSGAAAPPDTLLPRARAVAREHPSMWTRAPIARGERSIVIGGTASLAAELAARADRASRTIAAVWGPVDAVILVPATREQAAVLAAPARVEGFAAFAAAGRIIVEPAGFARLSGTGRQVVLTHELTHLATGAARTPDVPLWLSEGFADYVGYRDSGLDVSAVAAELAADVRSGAFPGTLPSRSGFEPASGRLAQAYEEAWLACRYIAGRYGEQRLVALYRATLRDDFVTALRQTLGLSEQGLTEAWRAYVQTELDRAPA